MVGRGESTETIKREGSGKSTAGETREYSALELLIWAGIAWPGVGPASQGLDPKDKNKL